MSAKATPLRSRMHRGARAYRCLVTVLGYINVKLAAMVTLCIWRMTRRYPLPKRETIWLEGAHSTFIQVDKRRVCVHRWGDETRPPVLLVHGWGGRGSQMAAFARPLVAAGYRVVAPDLPGHGQSDGQMTDFLECSHVLKRLEQKYGDFAAIIAHSFGAVVSTYALRTGMTSRACVLIGAPADGKKIMAAFTRWLSPPQRVIEQLQARLYRQFGDDVLLSMSPGEHARHLSMPCLLMHDEQDSDVSIKCAYTLKQYWVGSQLLRTQGLGHRRILRDKQCVQSAVDFIDDGGALLADSQSRHCANSVA